MNENLRKRKVEKKRQLAKDGDAHNSASTKVSNGCKLIKYVVLLMVLISTFFYVAYVSSPIRALPFTGVPLESMKYEGVLAINEDLTNGKRIYLPAPESIVEDDDGNLYTGLSNGSIIKIHPSSEGMIGAGKLEVFATVFFGNDDAVENNLKHGRGLGIRLRNNIIYGIDAFYGVYSLNLKSRQIERLVKPCDADPCMKFPDDLDVSADGEYIYFSDMSTEFSFDKMMYVGLDANCSGRIFKYFLHTKKLQLVMEDLCMPNGVQLSDDKKVLMVSEALRFRISWIDTNTWTRTHIQYIPAIPDNIRRNHKGTYWIGVSSKLTFISKTLIKHPFLRQIVAALISQSLFYRVINQQHNTLLEIDDQGHILRSFHDPNGKITYGLSVATELSDGRVALGSFRGDFMSIAVIKDQ